MWTPWKRNRQPATGRDPFERLARRVALLEADVDRLETAWQGTKDELRRSYARLEKANQRALERESVNQEVNTELGAPSAQESAFQKQSRLARIARGA